MAGRHHRRVVTAPPLEDEDDDEYEDDLDANRGALTQEMAKVSGRVRPEPFSRFVLPGCVRLR